MSLNINMNTINDLQTTVVNIFNGMLGEALAGLTGTLSGLLAGLTGKRGVHLSNLLSQFQTQFQSLEGLFADAVTLVSGVLANYQTQIGNFLTSLGQPQARSALLAAAQQTKGEIADAFGSLLNEALGHLTDIATSLANAGLASLLTALSGKRGLLDSFSDILNGITSTIGGHIDNITSAVVSLGSNLWGAVTPTLQDLQDQLTNHALNAGQSLLDSLASISSTLQG